MKYIKFLLIAAAVAACGDAAGVSAGGTFIVAVGQEQFRVRIDNALLATKARRMMTGAENQQIVNGELARGDGGFNTGFGWHMKPNAISFADVTIELCDGRPSDVQSDIDYWVDTVQRYCPWGGRFVSEVGR
ncbi:MAG: BP74-related protein [Gemmatimonadota bacterium]